MRIAVDCFPISDERTGIGHYTYHLLRAMGHLGSVEFHLIFARDARARHDFAYDAFKIIETPILMRQSLKRILWENLVLPGLLRKMKVDLYFSPGYILPLKKLACPSVISIHDLAFISYPRTKNRRYGTYLRIMVPISARRANAIIAVSDYTKGEVMRLIKVPEERVKRIYNGRDEDLEKEGGDTGMAADLGSYILYVGTLDPRKNITRLVEAFSVIKRESKLPHRLVLAGPRKFGYKEIRSAIKRLGLEKEVLEMGYLESRKIKELYRNATLFVFPSIYEGFGLPLLEAMACGVPIAASNGTAIPEVAGRAAMYFDPLKVDDIASAILRLIDDNELRADLVRKGFERVKLFSWEKCATETMDLFKSIIAAKR